MGWDCTLHLVDPERIRTVLVPRMLDRADARAALEGDPAEAAALLCRLAVVLSSAELPHRRLRGVALSLWDRVEGAGDPPYVLGDDPESMFADVVAHRSELHGHFPTAFTGNDQTGFYVRPERVGEVRAWLRRQLDLLPAASRAIVEPIDRVLEVAEQRGLGYWEATDLQVAQHHAEWLQHTPDLGTISLPAVPRFVTVQADVVWLSTDHRSMAVDPSTGTVDTVDLWVLATAQDADGRRVGVVRTGDKRWVVMAMDDRREIPLPEPDWAPANLVHFGSEVFCWPAGQPEFPLLRLVAGGWEGVDDLPLGRRPPADASPFRQWSTAGAGVLVWSGDVYRWTPGPGGGAFRPTGVCTFNRPDEIWVGVVSPDGGVRALSRHDLELEADAYLLGAFVRDLEVWLIVVRWGTSGTILRVPLERFHAVDPVAFPPLGPSLSTS